MQQSASTRSVTITRAIKDTSYHSELLPTNDEDGTGEHQDTNNSPVDAINRYDEIRSKQHYENAQGGTSSDAEHGHSRSNTPIEEPNDESNDKSAKNDDAKDEIGREGIVDQACGIDGVDERSPY